MTSKSIIGAVDFISRKEDNGFQQIEERAGRRNTEEKVLMNQETQYL